MLQLTLHVPAALGDVAASALRDHAYVLNVVRHVGACVRPDGDVLSCTIPREAVVDLLNDLEAVGVDEASSSITLNERVTVPASCRPATSHASSNTSSSRRPGSDGSSPASPAPRACSRSPAPRAKHSSACSSASRPSLQQP